MILLTASQRSSSAGDRSSEVEPLRVTLYTRALCCCCQTAREVLAEYEINYPGLVVEEVDASDSALEARIGPTMPVIAVDGRVRFRGEVNRVLMDRLIAAHSARS